MDVIYYQYNLTSKVLINDIASEVFTYYSALYKCLEAIFIKNIIISTPSDIIMVAYFENKKLPPTGVLLAILVRDRMEAVRFLPLKYLTATRFYVSLHSLLSTANFRRNSSLKYWSA